MAAQIAKLKGSVALTFHTQLQEGQYKSDKQTAEQGPSSDCAAAPSCADSPCTSLVGLSLRLLEVSEAMLQEIMQSELDESTGFTRGLVEFRGANTDEAALVTSNKTSVECTSAMP